MRRNLTDPMAPQSLGQIPVAEYNEDVLSTALSVLWRRRWFILGATTLAIGAGIIYLSVAPRHYASEALVQLDPGRQNSNIGAGATSAVSLDAQTIIQGELKIIQSRMIARRVVRRLHLADGTAVQSSSGWNPLPWLRSLLAPSALSTPDGGRQAAKPTPQEAAEQSAIDRLRSHLAIKADNRTYMISVSYTGARPETAAKIANAVAREYLLYRLEDNVNAAVEVSKWLAAQIKTARANLEEQEASITAFRNQTGVLDDRGGGEDPQQQQLRVLVDQLSAASLAKINAESRLSRIQGLVASGEIPSASDLTDVPGLLQIVERETTARKNLAELMAKLGPKHPDVLSARASLMELKATLLAEEKRAVLLARRGVQTAARTEQDIQKQIDTLRHALIETKAQQTVLLNKQAQAETTRERIKSLTRSYDQVSAQKDLRAITASLAVPAEVVPKPVSPRPAIVLAIFLFAGMGAGVSGVALTEALDRGFRTGKEVVGSAGVRYMGAVPDTTQRTGIQRLHRGTTPVAALQESVRTICAGLGLFDSRQGCQLLLVTSSLPGEGKTTLCRTLAHTLAQSGQRVLLVDRHSDPRPAARTRSDNALLPVPTTGNRSQTGRLLVLTRGPGNAAEPDFLAFRRIRRISRRRPQGL